MSVSLRRDKVPEEVLVKLKTWTGKAFANQEMLLKALDSAAC